MQGCWRVVFLFPLFRDPNSFREGEDRFSWGAISLPLSNKWHNMSDECMDA